MSKKYVIAKNEEQRDKNLKYISKKYNEKHKLRNRGSKKGKIIWERLVVALQFWKYRTTTFFFDEQLCKLYIDEIELFYINNFFSRRHLQIKKAHIAKEHEGQYSIKIPIFLSILAAVIYAEVFEKFGADFVKDVVTPIIEMCKQYLNIFIEKKILQYNLLDVLFLGVDIIGLIVIVILFLLIIAWVVNQGVDFFVLIFNGMNFNKKVIEEYEVDYIEKIAEKDAYPALIDALKLYEEGFFDIVNVLTYNYLIKNNKEYDTIDNIENELKMEFLNSSALEELEKMSLEICDKAIVIKSLIHRIYLKLNGKSQNLKLVNDKIYLT